MNNRKIIFRIFYTIDNIITTSPNILWKSI